MKKCSAFLAILASVAFIGCGDSAELVEQATLNPIPELREMAVLKLTDQTLLANIARDDSADSVRCAAVNRIDDQNILAELIRSDCDGNVKTIAIEKISDQKLLADLGVELAGKGDFYICGLIANKFTDTPTLTRIAQGIKNASDYDYSDELLDYLYSHLNFPTLAIEVAKGAQSTKVARRFLENLYPSDWEDVAKTAKSPAIRMFVTEEFIRDEAVALENYKSIALDKTIPTETRAEAAFKIKNDDILRSVLVEILKVETDYDRGRHILENNSFSQQDYYDIVVGVTEQADGNISFYSVQMITDKTLLKKLLGDPRVDFDDRRIAIENLDRATIEEALKDVTDETIRKEIEDQIKTL